MGSDDIFKKRRAEREQRKHDILHPKANSFLIVTEGERTEPLYFEGMKKLIQQKMGGNIDIVEKPDIKISGEGTSTSNLIEITDDLVKKSKIIYQNIWVVFDKDDFDDFDDAIKKGISKGYKIAWSNQCFEYWIYLHFNYSDAALHRYNWNKKLDGLFSTYNLGSGKYQKNYEDIYDMLNRIDGVNTAISNAKSRMKEFYKNKINPSKFDPGTTVYELVEELKRYIDE